MAAYKEFSYYYDSLMDPDFYSEYLKFIHEHANLKTVLELGCGTGLTAIELAKEGHQVLATDLSEDMVNITALKAKDEGVELLTETIDMCDFALSQPVDTILCLTDAINYVLSKKKVQDVFNNVYEGLKYNGTFIFDVNSLYKCNVILDDYHEKNEDEDFFFSWDVESDHKGRYYPLILLLTKMVIMLMKHIVKKHFLLKNMYRCLKSRI
jgi:BchM-ChlM: magnesium protoporphyrin O-methyltransferase